MKVEFCPNNSKVLAVMYPHEIQIYEIEDRFELGKDNTLEECINVSIRHSFHPQEGEKFETFIWDELNNVVNN